MTGRTWLGELYEPGGVRCSILVWVAFSVPAVILSKLSWLESVTCWSVLGVVGLLISGVTVGIVQATSRIGQGERLPPAAPGPTPTGGHGGPDANRSTRTALVASVTTWAIAWLLILSALVPDQAVRRSEIDTARSLVGLGMFGLAVLLMCGAIGAIFLSSDYALSGASWAWHRFTGRDSMSEKLGGPTGLALALILSLAAVTGWLWFLTQVMQLAMSYAGWPP